MVGISCMVNSSYRLFMTFVSDARYVLIYLVYFVLISTCDEINTFPDIFVDFVI